MASRQSASSRSAGSRTCPYRCGARGAASGPWNRASPPASGRRAVSCRSRPAPQARRACSARGRRRPRTASSPSAPASVFCAASDSGPAVFGASSFSGGMRTLCPSSSRSLLSTRLPSTRSSPLRTTRWMWENDRPGKRASRKRSTRMLFSSAVTLTVCTLVGSSASTGFSGARPFRRSLSERSLGRAPLGALGLKARRLRPRLAARSRPRSSRHAP